MRKGKYAKRGMAGKTLVLVLALVMLIGGTVGGTLAWLMDKSETVTNTFTDSDINIGLDETTTTYKMAPGWTIDKDPYVTVEANSEDCWLFIEVTESTDPVLANYLRYSVDTDEVTTTQKQIPEVTEPITVAHGGWTKGDGTKVPDNVYYRKVTANTTDNQYFAVLGDGTYVDANQVSYAWADDEVLVLPEVTKQMMDAIDGFNAEGKEDKTEKQPTLTFTAYAVQLWKSNKPANMDDADAVAKAQFSAADAWAKAAAMKPTTGSGT